MRHLGLIPKPTEALHGFTPNELDSQFAGVSVSPLEEIVDVDSILEGSGHEGFNLNPSRLMTLSLLFLTFPLRLGGGCDTSKCHIKAFIIH